MNKEVEEVFKRLELFKLDMNKNIEDIYHRLYITFDDNEILYLLEYIEELQQENKELHNKIDKAIEILKEHFVEEYIRSCDTSDGVGRCEIDTEHWTYKAYEILKDSDVDE